MAVAADDLVESKGIWARLRAARLETTVAVGSLLAVALHILDDNFLQPAPGTGTADHLISGIVPLAAFVVAAVAYPRLRNGARASLAAVAGVLGIVIGGVEPAYYGRSDGLSGDDFTGVIAAAAGAALVGVAIVTAWRTRRRHDRLVWRYVRRALTGAGAAAVLFFVLFPFSLSYGFTHAARVETPRGDLGARYEPVAFDADDGLRLKGWFVAPKNGATVIVYPGKKGTQKHARMLVRHGYGVLVFDRRGEGESEGDPNALGWGFDHDLLGALAFLRSRQEVDPNRIGGLGLSVGGEAFLQTAAETRDLKAVVSDGAGSRSVREDTVRMSAHKIGEIVFSGVMTAGMALFSNRAPPPNLEGLVDRISPTPVFFIYATHGAGGEDNNPNYFRAAREPKQIWRIDTSHTHGLTARPQEYERRVIGFFDRALAVR
jgi:dienelactone hydrolase